MKPNKILFLLIFFTVLVFNSAFCQWIKQDSKSNKMILGAKFVNSNVGYACGGNHIISKTVNGGYSWQICNFDSLNTTPFYSIECANTDTIVAVGDKNISYSHNTGLKWTESKLSTPINWRRVKFFNNKFYAVGQFGSLGVSSDYGKTWIISSISSSDIYDIFPIDSLNWVACGNSGIFLKTNNAGKTWSSQTINTFGRGGLLISTYFLSLTKGYLVGENGIFLETKNGGATWTEVSNLTSSEMFSNVKFIDEKQGIIVGGDIYTNSSRVIYTIDGGITWKSDSSKNLGSRLYGLSAISRSSFLITDISGNIYSGNPSDSDGNDQLNINSSNIKSSLKSYPNPNNGFFAIDFPSGFEGHKRLSIYNDLGILQETKEIIGNELNMSSYPSGTYFIGIFNKTNVFYTKVILIKQT